MPDVAYNSRRDEFLVVWSNRVSDGSVTDMGIAASTATGRWLPVWAADDPQPPLADEEYEVYGRFVGERLDLDGDGDGDGATVPPGAVPPPPPGTAPRTTLVLTGARIARRFRVCARFTRVRRLAVVGARRGMRIEVRCRGRGCPRALRRRARRIDVARDGRAPRRRALCLAPGSTRPGACVP